jgi:hypothetical protein
MVNGLNLQSLVKYENPVLISSTKEKKLKGKTGVKGELLDVREHERHVPPLVENMERHFPRLCPGLFQILVTFSGKRLLI